jgi:short subunit dehydrogenase-like uncharacterized protein
VLVLYGAYGYTGELVAWRAVERGLRPVLAGRDPERVTRLARALGLPHRIFPLDDAEAVEGGLAGAKAVLNCAGPFARTFRPLAEACLRARCHYLDVTGEISVLEGLFALGPDAERAGVMLLPAAGFDVVPTDCLAAHLARRLPGATRLALAFQALGRMSRGTARTVLEGGASRGGHRTRQPVLRTIDLGEGPRRALSVPWGDVFTAPLSTGIDDVAVYAALPLPMLLAAPALVAAGPLLRVRAVRYAAASALARGRPGPSAAERAVGRSLVWGEAADAGGRVARARLRAPEAYAFTALAAVEIAERVLAGGARPGFQTPSTAFGPDLVLSIPGVGREDL